MRTGKLTMKPWKASRVILTHPDSGALSYTDALSWWVKRADSSRFLYRGQEKAVWPINAKIARYDRPSRMDPDQFERDILDIGRRMVKDFRAESSFLDDILGVPWNDRIVDPERLTVQAQDKLLLIWEMAAQHYGVPTRLIDWSTSFQVALFFAYGGWSGMQRRDGLAPAVWCLNRKLFESGAAKKAGTLKRYEAAADGIRVVPGGRYVNTRQRAQGGWFTYMYHSLTGIPEYLEANRRHFPDGTLIRLVLKASEEKTVLRTLAESGITAASIRRDAEGIACDAIHKHLRFEFAKLKA